MAETVGKIYSTAFFELCCEEDCLDRGYEELKEFCSLVCGSDDGDMREFEKLLCSPLISAEDKGECLRNVFGGSLSALTLDFLCLICDKGRFGSMKEIFEDLRVMYNDRKNILEVTAVTAAPLTEELREKLTAKLGRTTGRTVVLTEMQDKSIIGGMIVRYGNTEIDASVKSRLEKLKAQINGTIA
ncbi:MAG: ATP synthase F1 subunit delta [Ruminococcus sp.]|nr:ATP synthase F1 subunit delta [Ruminococcus sp.]